ncbi:hypothetical protein [Kribbella sp. CA-294648]|uniref:hypothetical protein n=1 Tax=Kribbella sp. CA-294648 TaxID=3239948 RepID=UPI003D912765
MEPTPPHQPPPHPGHLPQDEGPAADGSGLPPQDGSGLPPQGGSGVPAQGGYGFAPQGGYPAQGGYPPPGVGQPGFPAYPGGRNELVRPGSGGTSSVAVLGFIFSLVAAIPVAVVLCVVALNRIPRLAQKGKGLAVAGLVITGVWVLGLSVAGFLYGAGSEPDRDASGQVTTKQTTRPDKLRVGDCVTELKEGDVKDIGIQPCDQPNGGKVFAVFDLPAGKWPGLATVQAAAEKGCTDRFKAAKVKPDKPSDIFFLHPVEDGWALGDRGTTCLLTPR